MARERQRETKRWPSRWRSGAALATVALQPLLPPSAPEPLARKTATCPDCRTRLATFTRQERVAQVLCVSCGRYVEAAITD
jgi:hypothetical protein